MAIIYGLKVNLSVAMVGMLNHTALSMEGSHGSHDTSSNMTYVSAPELEECGDTGGNSSSAPEVIYEYDRFGYFTIGRLKQQGYLHWVKIICLMLGDIRDNGELTVSQRTGVRIPFIFTKT